jgi:hypothetical protein
MAFHAETSELSATAVELRALSALGLARVARLFNVDLRSARRWRDGTRQLPRGAAIVLRLLVDEVITIDQLEQAARTNDDERIARPNDSERVARTNGSAQPEPLAPRRVEPAPEPSAVAEDGEAAAPVDSGPTAAEQVFALTARSCRWPIGDPGDHGFRFCGDPVITRPYCAAHRVTAYVTATPTRPEQAPAGGRVALSPITGLPRRRQAP